MLSLSLFIDVVADIAYFVAVVVIVIVDRVVADNISVFRIYAAELLSLLLECCLFQKMYSRTLRFTSYALPTTLDRLRWTDCPLPTTLDGLHSTDYAWLTALDQLCLTNYAQPTKLNWLD